MAYHAVLVGAEQVLMGCYKVALLSGHVEGVQACHALIQASG